MEEEEEGEGEEKEEEKEKEEVTVVLTLSRLRTLVCWRMSMLGGQGLQTDNPTSDLWDGNQTCKHSPSPSFLSIPPSTSPSVATSRCVHIHGLVIKVLQEKPQVPSLTTASSPMTWSLVTQRSSFVALRR